METITPIKEKPKKKEPKPSRFDNAPAVVREAFNYCLNDPIKIKVEKKKKLNKSIYDEKDIIYHALSSSENGLIFTLRRGARPNIITNLGSFNLNKLEGCDGVAVLNYLTTNSHYYNHGYGAFLHRVAEKIAYDLGFVLIQGTVIAQMKKELGLLKKIEGWQRVNSFRNHNSGNTVHFYIKALR